MIRGFSTLAALAALLGAAGCGSDRYPVTGKVTYEDGSPLTEGSVTGEMGDGADRVMVQGDVRPDGSFEWGTLKPGDGAKPGKYRVIVTPLALGDSELAKGMQPAVDDKFTRYETSGIEFEVKAGKNELNITVTKPKSKKK
jgi:hypothetical protein